LDKVSEFLMVEACGFHLYQVVAGRCKTAKLKAKYQELGRETAHHRDVLTTLIVGGLSQAEIEMSHLENVLLAETRDHADWHVLAQMAQQASDKMKAALQARAADHQLPPGAVQERAGLVGQP
jgi:hypothetical protein